jgi:predicted secreted protein
MAATSSDTDVGFGIILQKRTAPNSDTFVTLAEVVEFTPPETTRDGVDFTHMASPEGWREFKPSKLKDAGEAQLVYNLIPGEADDDVIADHFASNAVDSWRLTYPNGAKLEYLGFATSHQHATPMDDKMTGSATFKISGKPIITPAP